MIERDLDVPFVADPALREKQIQQKPDGVVDSPPGDHRPEARRLLPIRLCGARN
jgi:hypothetical protein